MWVRGRAEQKRSLTKEQMFFIFDLPQIAASMLGYLVHTRNKIINNFGKLWLEWRIPVLGF
jgi:hypothetical protein